MSQTKRNPFYAFVLYLILPAIIAFGVHKVLFSGLDAPPSDYGSGSMFDLIANRYDTINRVLAIGMDTGWRRRMVHVIRDNTDASQPRILDLATGTADVALLLRTEIPKALVMGIDPSNQMLDVGRNKVKKGGLDASITLQQADAQDLVGTVFQESSFDAATMAFGIRNVPDRSKALCQIHGVLKDQATFCILEFSEPDDSFGTMGALARLFIRHVVPFLGGVLSGAPREYWHLQNSIKDFPAPKDFARFIESVECERGSFQVKELIQINFGTVQLYVTKVQKDPLER